MQNNQLSECKIYSLFGGETGAMVELTEKGKDNLPAGTRLRMNGYNDPDYIIIKTRNVGGNYGTQYIAVDPENLSQHFIGAYSLKFWAEKKDNRIQVYIMPNEPAPAAMVADLWEKSEEKRTAAESAADKAKAERKAIIEKGKAFIDARIPKNAKAVIVGYEKIDDCDPMTDYFNTARGDLFILAWSTHTRDIFSEMRKAARNHPETEHLATAPTVNNNREEKTDRNKSWWHPADEHREKHSMGAGFYLKSANRYSTGWKVEKERLDWASTMEGIYYAAGCGRYCIPEPRESEKEPANGKTITLNEEKNGIEITFSEKPSRETLDTLKMAGFRWHRKLKFWYAKQTANRLEIVNAI